MAFIHNAIPEHTVVAASGGPFRTNLLQSASSPAVVITKFRGRILANIHACYKRPSWRPVLPHGELVNPVPNDNPAVIECAVSCHPGAGDFSVALQGNRRLP